MQKIMERLLTSVQFIAALILISLSLIIMCWSIYEMFINFNVSGDFIPLMLTSVGAVIISAAILDVAGYIIEEEVFKEKELRDPVEARKTLTKIIVIITIAVSIEGLVYIFKAGTYDIKLLLYPSFLILSAAVLIIALGVYQKLSGSIERIENKHLNKSS